MTKKAKAARSGQAEVRPNFQGVWTEGRKATRRDPSATTTQLARDDHGIGCDVDGCTLEAVIAIGSVLPYSIKGDNTKPRAVRCQNHLTCAERL